MTQINFDSRDLASVVWLQIRANHLKMVNRKIIKNQVLNSFLFGRLVAALISE